MKKHLQFNDITALSLGWRAARRGAEREESRKRGGKRTKFIFPFVHFYQGNITSFPPLVLLSCVFFCLFHLHFSFFPSRLLFNFSLPFIAFWFDSLCALCALYMFPILSLLSPKENVYPALCRFSSRHYGSPAAVQPYKRIAALNSRFQSPCKSGTPSLRHSVLFLFKDMTILRCNPQKSKALPVRSSKYYLTIDNHHLNLSCLENEIYMAKWPQLVC